ncbi:hypothetical protein DCAR_0520084 [Daucus carota subsp. sativus]|uniref:Reverse transcriptase Ty1/copia-type domain-containing protein n=1 Tax=Daucus carota subsp. sativus TaxID=79200 RepID=A0AAF1AZP5_DAUCS|nr:PREDICTED: uncharacterized mitochondrial protein AtMg00810-like [Daucus carota subsp. sativus]WOH00710.1 hypothetical protein DCAR_0520084 [Daucus carota subsp. sativus]
MITARILLCVAASNQWIVDQMDVTNAFLHGDLKETVYMRMPPGYHLLSNIPQSFSATAVCKLTKSLYGLKQAPREWFSKLSTALKQFGFCQSHSDNSMFTIVKDGAFCGVLVYVDDILVTGASAVLDAEVKAFLRSKFKIKDVGPLKYFLGIEVARSTAGFYLNQRKYVLDLMTDTGLMYAKPSTIPMEQNHHLTDNESALLNSLDTSLYRRIVGKLIYLTITRPDVCYSVHILSQFIHQPCSDHLQAAFKVLRFLKSSPGQGLLISSSASLHLTAYCDSDWAGCQFTRLSLTGYCIKLGDSLVSWKCKKQHTVSKSSVEAEYRSMADTCCEVVWLVALLKNFLISPKLPIPFYCDSQSTLYIAANPVFHERTKHIEIDCHIVREKLIRGLIAPTHISTTEQRADMFTKALGAAALQFLSSKLNVCNLLQPSTLRKDVT